MEIEESLYVLVSSSACPNYRTDVQFTSGHFYSDSNNNSFAFFFFLKVYKYNNCSQVSKNSLVLVHITDPMIW